MFIENESKISHLSRYMHWWLYRTKKYIFLWKLSFSVERHSDYCVTCYTAKMKIPDSGLYKHRKMPSLEIESREIKLFRHDFNGTMLAISGKEMQESTAKCSSKCWMQKPSEDTFNIKNKLREREKDQWHVRRRSTNR